MWCLGYWNIFMDWSLILWNQREILAPQGVWALRGCQLSAPGVTLVGVGARLPHTVLLPAAESDELCAGTAGCWSPRVWLQVRGAPLAGRKREGFPLLTYSSGCEHLVSGHQICHVRKSPCYSLGILSSPVPPLDLWIGHLLMSVGICWWAGATWQLVWIYWFTVWSWPPLFREPHGTTDSSSFPLVPFCLCCFLITVRSVISPHSSSQFQGAVLVQTRFLLAEVTYLRIGLDALIGLTWDRGVHSSESLSQGWPQTLLHLFLMSPLGGYCCNYSS